MRTTWHVTCDGKGVLVVQRPTLGEAIVQARRAGKDSLEGEWAGHLYPCDCTRGCPDRR